MNLNVSCLNSAAYPRANVWGGKFSGGAETMRLREEEGGKKKQMHAGSTSTERDHFHILSASTFWLSFIKIGLLRVIFLSRWETLKSLQFGTRLRC